MNRSGALPDPRDHPRVDDLSWKPLEDAPDGWEVAHRGAGRYLLRDPSGHVLNGLDHLWSLEECREEIEVEGTLERRAEGDGTSPLARLHSIRRSWLGWSVERLQEEAAEILGREEPVALEELSDTALVGLRGTWERVH